MKQWVIFFILCGLVVANGVLLAINDKMRAEANLKYKEAAGIRQANDAKLSKIGADQVQTLKLVLEIRDKLDHRIGDGPNTGEAPQ